MSKNQFLSEELNNFDNNLKAKTSKLADTDALLAEEQDKFIALCVELDESKNSIQDLSFEVKSAKQKTKNAQKRISKYKRKLQDSTECPSAKQLHELKVKVQSVKNENEILRDNDFLKNDNVLISENGKFTDAVRQVYMELLSKNVSSRKCQDVIRIILKNLANKDVGHLPKKSVAAMMQTEAAILVKHRQGKLS